TGSSDSQTKSNLSFSPYGIVVCKDDGICKQVATQIKNGGCVSYAVTISCYIQTNCIFCVCSKRCTGGNSFAISLSARRRINGTRTFEIPYIPTSIKAQYNKGSVSSGITHPSEKTKACRCKIREA